jgi:hypothetical protein
MTATKKRPAPWTPAENQNCVALYFAMIAAQQTKDEFGMAYNKAGMIRHARGEAVGAYMTTVEHGSLAERSRPSIEMKLMNCSAIHKDLGATYTMDDYGYRAMPNYQQALKQAMSDYLEEAQHEADVLTASANEQRAGA